MQAPTTVVWAGRDAKFVVFKFHLIHYFPEGYTSELLDPHEGDLELMCYYVNMQVLPFSFSTCSLLHELR